MRSEPIIFSRRAFGVRRSWAGALSLFLSLPLHAATLSWSGSASGDWFNAANWSPARIPSSADAVVIDLNAAVSASGATSIAFASLTLGDAAGSFSPTLRLSAAQNTSGSVTIHRGAKLQQDTNQQVVFGSLTVMPGGLLTHAANSSARSFLINLSVAGDFNLQTGATISASGLGYSGGAGYQISGSGPGGGRGNDSSSGSGGGHGGVGGLGRNATLPGGAAYDSVTNPTDLGSGGGGAYLSVLGGRGGGAVLVNVGGSLILNGLIVADGADGAGDPHGSGGGAGGTVNLMAATISGTGAVRANGGNGAGTSGGQGGGGGGGGRIAIVVASNDSSSLSLAADTGAGGITDGKTGGAGVIAYKGPSATNYSLNIGGLSVTPLGGTPITGASSVFGAVTIGNAIARFDAGSTATMNSFAVSGAAAVTGNNIVLSASAPFEIKGGGALSLAAQSITGGALIVRGNGIFRQTSAAMLNFGSVHVEKGGMITHAANSTSRSAVVNLSATGDFNLQAGATISVSGLGYSGGAGYQASGNGPGGGPGNTSSSGSGGGHGGTGGLGRNATLPGGAGYDSVTNPADLGSGGGGAYPDVLGGRGGGAVLVNVSGNLILNGLIAADGAEGEGPVHGGGGGAGGTVSLTATTLSGTGAVRANGGVGGGTSTGQGGGGGGGGRIAIAVASNDASSLTLAADTGTGGITDGKTGGAGVVAYKGPSATSYALNIGGVAVAALGATPLTSSPAFGVVAITNAIVSGSTVTLAALSASGAVGVTASNIVLGAATPIEVRSGATLNFTVQSITGGALTVRGNGVFRQMNAAALNFGSVLVEKGGLITHAANSTARSAVVNLGATGDFSLQAGATISASGLGYDGGAGYQVNGSGPGGGPGNTSSSGSGGGHGGEGGQGSNATVPGGATNDSATNPADLGSGGGGGYPSVLGGRGGGAVLLIAGGNVYLNGLIAADGTDGSGAVHGSGGGSGGTVNIRAAAVSGQGMVRANGGAGGGESGQGGGGGAGGRIAVTGTRASTVVLEVAGGAAGRLNGSVGARGTIIDNGVLSGGTTTPAAILAFSQMQERLATTKVLGETLSAQLFDFAGATSTGVPAGSFSLAEMRLVMIKTGPFANKGFFRGRWTLAIPGGVPLAGEWEGMAFFEAGASQRLVLKGVLKGQIQGVLEGSLTESAAGSGTFDRLAASCRLVQAANTMGSSAIHISGAGVVRETVLYPGTVLNYLQAAQSGEVGGYYSTPLDIAFSLVRVDSPGNPYHGEGFFAASYESPLGPGSGWAYAAVSGASARLAGVFDQSLRGLMEGTLTVDSPRALFLTLQNLDAGLPLNADINLTLAMPGNVPVGGLATVIVELRNDGYAVAEGVTVVAIAPEKSRFMSATGDYRSYNVTHWRGTEYAPKPFVRWDFASVPARSSQKMSYQVRLPAGQPGAYQSAVGVETVTKAWADTIFANYHLGETP